MHACVSLKKFSKKRKMSRFFCGNISFVFCGIKYSTNSFWKDKDFFNRPIKTFINFIAITIFSLLFFFIFLYIHILPNKSAGNIYHLHFIFYTFNRVLLLLNKHIERLSRVETYRKLDLLLFSFCFSALDTLWYLLLAYSLVLFFSSSDNPLYLSRTIFCNLPLSSPCTMHYTTFLCTFLYFCLSSLNISISCIFSCLIIFFFK